MQTLSNNSFAFLSINLQKSDAFLQSVLEKSHLDYPASTSMMKFEILTISQECKNASAQDFHLTNAASKKILNCPFTFTCCAAGLPVAESGPINCWISRNRLIYNHISNNLEIKDVIINISVV